MKILAYLVMIGILVSTSIAISQEHQHDKINDAEMNGGMMMNHEKMKEMHEHMQQMTMLMKKIKQESNSEKRHKLMKQHMQSMKNGMNMMDMCKKTMFNKKMKANVTLKTMTERMQKMEEHMNMMQIMMGQMMQHSGEQMKNPEHKH